MAARRRPVLLTMVFGLLTLAGAGLSHAQSPTDFFLHGIGPDNNPPTLFLDTTAPTAGTAKFRDSTSVNFSGGNPWKEIGTWPAASALTGGTLNALSDLHVWLGLKNSDDQGTQFDLRAEIYKNSTVLASGLTRCITGITRNPANAKEATVSFGTVSPTEFNGSTDTLSLKILTRIGTNPDDTKCPGHNNAVGLRLYFDATTRNARFDATIVTVQPPTITSFTPTNARVGTTVAVIGTNFVNVSSVTFNGTAATTVTVPNATTLTAVVPAGATTGPLAVTTPGGTATSTGHFVVLPTPDFQIGAAPSTLVIPASGQASYAVSLTGSGGFTNLATLAVTGLPTGTTAAFRRATLTAGQLTLLTLTTSGTTPAGTYPLTVTAVGPVDGVSTVRSVPVTIEVQAPGVTSLTGQVLDEDARPVKGVLVKLGALQVSTDDGGNFLLLNPPAGADQLLLIDGGPASTPQHSLPIVPYKVTIVAGQANTLGFTPHLHFQKTTGLVDISDSAVQRVVTDPDLPGFQMTIPAGVTITGWDGQPNTQISIRRVPIDRVPLPPFPADRYVPALYMDYFGKQGGGTPSAPIPITFPNDLDVPPGTQVELWYFDEAPDGTRPNQWVQYGTGTVTADGSQVVPDTDPSTGQPFGQPRFCCGAVYLAMLNPQRNAVVPPSPSMSGTTSGEPVDLATGLFTLEKTDLVLPDRLPVTFTRTYQTNSSVPGPFGPGTGHSFETRLLVQANLWTLVLPNGARALFPKQPDGTYRNSNDPSMQGAVFTDIPSGPILRFKDGRRWTFGAPVPGALFLTSQRDRNDNTITLTRSGTAQNLTTITAPSGRQLNLTYDANNRITAIQDPLGRIIRYAYDNAGRLATVTDPTGGVTRYTYDAAGRMLTITDPRGIVFLTNQYDSAGRVSRQTQADGGVWEFAYTTAGSVITQTTVIDPRGNTTAYRFNGRGYLLSQTDGFGQMTAFTRDTRNRVIATIDPLGRTTRFEYDAVGNVTKITDPNSQVTRFEYEPTFNRVTRIDQILTPTTTLTTTFAYDPANGNRVTVTDPLTHTTTIGYNAFGQPTSVQGPIPTEPPTTFSYDPNGNLITTTDPLGNTTTRASDLVSRLTRLTDPRGFATQFRYDPLNRVTEIADAAHGVTKFTYDGNGNLLTVTDAKNQTTTYTYDTMDRLATRKDALNRSESYQYDSMGNLTEFTDRKSQVSQFTYDALNRRTSASYQDGSTVSFIYDAVGRLSRTTDSLSGSIDFAYDTLDRLTLELTSLGALTYQYDAISRRTKMTVAGQAPVSYQYDAASRLIQIAQGALAVGLGYDNANRRTSLTYPNGTSASYAYDAASRLTDITHIGPSGLLEGLTYIYDTAGNRTSLIRANGAASLLPSAVTLATYDAANQQTQFGGATLTYDQNGNLTNDGTNTYTWDARNRLVGISGGVTASFSYDSLGRRISKTISGSTTQFVYDGQDIVQETSGSTLGATYIRSLNIDEPFVRQVTSNEYYHADALGSTLVLSNVTGVSAVTYNYEPFGKTTSTGASSNPFQYTGRESDGTGLHYYRARYYQPQFSRFVRRDPIGLRGGVNLYSYVFNKPTNFFDPNGMDAWTAYETGGIIGAGPFAFNLAQGILAINTATGEMCTYTIGCLRPGLSLILGVGGKFQATLGGAHCGRNLGGFSFSLAGDIIVPEPPPAPGGIGGSIGIGLDGAIGGGYSWGPNWGAGISAGVDVCYAKVNRCVNSPKKCERC
ncbi:MAG: RHS repeat-associated core domain-containing protein [Nitrospirota bacterium]